MFCVSPEDNALPWAQVPQVSLAPLGMVNHPYPLGEGSCPAFPLLIEL